MNEAVDVALFQLFIQASVDSYGTMMTLPVKDEEIASKTLAEFKTRNNCKEFRESYHHLLQQYH
jgi:hypothetical protein